MKQLLWVFFVILLTPLFTTAQSNYKPGYVITLNSDTIRGFIDLREWFGNPKVIRFKRSVSESAVNYTIQHIRAFEVAGLESYVRYIGPISIDNTNINRLSDYRDTSFKSDTVFLKVLQKGPNISLFSYTDYLKTRFFITDKFNTTPLELIYRVYNGSSVTDDSRSNVTVKTEEGYKRQLLKEADQLGLMDENLSLHVQRAQYDMVDLLKITSILNKLNSPSYKSVSPKFIDIYFGAGVEATSNTVDKGSEFAKSGVKPNTSILPVIDAGLIFYGNPSTKRLFFKFGFSVAENQFNSSYNNQIYPYVPVTYKFTQLAIGFTPQLCYNFYNAESFKFYMSAGFSFIYSSYSNQAFKSSQTDIISENDPFLFNKTQSTEVIGTGFIINQKWNINCQYVFPANTTYSPFYTLNESRASLGINYIF
jgi:hypothetical protein